ncbi:MAG: methionyl-tRNA formyltransferase [Deltaproteobacteria bacterium]|nr:methionyl-tRNA formyltransferase [Deltaproteobacteria bacterium]
MNSPIRVVFFGTPEFSADCLRELLNSPRYTVTAVVTQPDREAGRGKKLTPSPVKLVAVERNIPVLQPSSVKKNLSGFLTELSAFGPFDIGVVVAFGQILPQQLLDTPRCGCVNVHASLLPRWRGAAPIQRAIMEGDAETGVCLMHMEAGLDTGAVYSVRKIPIESDDTSASLFKKLAQLGATQLREDLSRITSGELKAVPQPESGVTYAKKIPNDEAHINWNLDAHHISRCIRGLNPAPGAFTQLRGLRLKIFSATPKSASVPPAQPGAVSRLTTETLEVVCGTGILSLEEVQLEGKRRMPIAEFLRGGSIRLEDVLV